jgi:hypothetical protein
MMSTPVEVEKFTVFLLSVAVILLMILGGALTTSRAESTTLKAVGRDFPKEGAANKELSPRNASIEDWPVFHDDEYGVEIRYPAAWAFREAEIDSSTGNIPIRRVVEFGSRSWEGLVMPVSIEIGIGSLEELQDMWPLSDGQGNVTTPHIYINGYMVRTGKGMYGETFYIFEHPVHSELQVAVRDNVGDADTTDIVQQMLSTFAFTYIHPPTR